MKFRFFIIVAACLLSSAVRSQEVLLFENMGNPAAATQIADNTFQNGPPLFFSGNALAISSSPSATYPGASGGGNILFQTIGDWFQIENINTVGVTNISLSLGHRKSTNAANNELLIEVSHNGIAWTNLDYTHAPGSGTMSKWKLITPTGTIPSTPNLRIRFRNTTETDWRIDDIKLMGTPSISWANLHSPPSGTIITGGGFVVSAQVLADGYTYIDGMQTGVIAEIGYSSNDSDPSGPDWTWVPALYSAQAGNADQYVLDLGGEIFVPGLYYYASRFSIAGGPPSYGGYSAGGGGFWNGTTRVSGQLTVIDTQVVHADLQSPFSGSQLALEPYVVTAQVYQPGLTEGPGQGADVQAWIGYSQSNTSPNSPDWSWIPATYDPAVVGNSDQYFADIGPFLNANATFYYASRFQLGTGTYSYGAFNIDGTPGDDFWDGISYISGTVVISGASSPGDYYRSSASGPWDEITTWESSSDNASWQDATKSPTADATSIIIRNGHTIITWSNVTADDITVESGGTLDLSDATFTLNNGAAGIDLQVDGTLTNSGANFIQGGAVSVAGTYNHATDVMVLPVATWEPGSNCNVTGLANVIQTPLVNGGQIYHNFTFSNDNSEHLVSILGPTFQVNGTRTVGPAPGSYLLLGTTLGSFTRTVNKLDILSGQLTVSGSQSNVTLNVLSDVTVSGGRLGLSGGLNGRATVNVANDLMVTDEGILSMIDHSSAQSPVLNVGNNLIVSGIEPTIDMEAASSNAAISTINIAQDFISTSLTDLYPIIDFGSGIVTDNAVNISGNFSKSGDGVFYTSSIMPAKGFVFTGSGDVQTLTYSGANSTCVNYTVNSGAVLKLSSDLTLGNGVIFPHSQFVVRGGGTLDFDIHSIIASDATSKFIALGAAAPAATLATAHPDGLGGTTTTGSLQNFADVGPLASNAIRIQGAVNYTFNGTTTTPFFLPTTSMTNAGHLVINADVQSNMDSSLTLTGSLTVNSGGSYTLNPLSSVNNHSMASSAFFHIAENATFDNGGENRVIKGSGTPVVTIDGTFITRDVQGFIGTNAALASYNAADITLGDNSVIEYGLNGDQIVQGMTAPVYKNVAFSNGGIKTLQSANAVTGTIELSDAATFDAVNFTFGSAGSNVTITGSSTYKTGGSGVKPDSGGTYSLAPGTTIEYYSPSVAATNPRKSGIIYADVVINGNNIVNTGVSGLKFQPSATFTVKTNAIFKLQNPDGFTGSTSTAIDVTAPPTFVFEPESAIEYSALADQTITPLISGYPNLNISGSGIKSFAFSPQIMVNEDLNVKSATLQIDPDVTMIVTDAVKNTGGVIDIKNAGSLVQITDVLNATANNNVGNIRMERNANNMYRYDFTYWSSPVTESSGFTLAELSPLPLWDKYMKWNPVTQSWLGIPYGTENMHSGVGYIVRAPENFFENPALTLPFTALFEGTPNNGTVTVPTTGSSSLAEADYKFNLLGNPYPSALFADAFIAANPDLGGTLYFWTHNTATSSVPDANGIYQYSQADYATYNLSGGTQAAPSSTTGGANANVPTGRVGAGQGFFIRGITDGPSVATFNNSMRIAGNNGQFFRQADGSQLSNNTDIERHRIWLNLTNPDSAFSQSLVAYAEGATNARDRLFDGEILGGQIVALYSLIDQAKFSSQGRSLPFIVSDTVPLGYKTTVGGPLQIAIDHVDGLFNSQDIFIEDKLLQVIHDLNQAPYIFTSDVGTFDDRFLLRYTSDALGVSDFESGEFVVSVKDRQITLNAFSRIISEIVIFDLVGHKLFETKGVNSDIYTASDVIMSQQVLIVKTKFTDGTEINTKIVY